MTNWTIEIWSLDGTTSLVAPARFLTARCTWALEGNHALEVTLGPDEIDDGDWLFGRRRLKLKDPDGTVQFHGWLERVERSGGPDQEITFTASAVGLAGAIFHGVVHPDLEITDTGPEVAWALIENAQAQTDNVWNFTQGSINGGGGSSHYRNYAEGDEIRPGIDELASLFANGFDLDVLPDGSFTTWRPLRGLDRRGSKVLLETDTIDFNIWGDFSDAATYVTAVGVDLSCGPLLETASDTADNIDSRYGRREIVVDFQQEDDESDLLERAQHEIRIRRSVRRGARAAWLEGMGPWDFGDVWLGDAVFIAEGEPFAADLPDGVFQQDAFQDGVFFYAHGFRLTTVTLTLEPGKHAFVETEWERCWPTVEGLPEE